MEKRVMIGEKFDGNMEYFHEGANDYVRLLDRDDMQQLPLEFTSSGVKAALPFNVLLKARQASLKNKPATLNVVPEECILPLSYYSAYFMSKEGTMKDMIDRQTRLIMGEFLDSVSEEVEETLNRLNDIIKH